LIAAFGHQSVSGQPVVQKNVSTKARLVVPARFRSVEEAISGLERIRDSFIARHDRRGVFAATYVESTRAFHDSLRQRRYESNKKMARFVVAFANAYRQALADYERGAPTPEAWRTSFDISRSGTSTVSEDLLLGINAHVNYDIAFAILHAGIDVRSEMSHRDHLRANQVLREATPRVRRKIVQVYRPPGAWVSWLFARRIDEATAASFIHARNNAWAAATAIATTRSVERRRLFRRAVERCSARAALGIHANKNSPGRALSIMTAANDWFSAESAPRLKRPGENKVASAERAALVFSRPLCASVP
jgi:hypothetical protein